MSSRKKTGKEKYPSNRQVEEDTVSDKEPISLPSKTKAIDKKLFFILSGIIFAVAFLLYANTLQHEYVLDDFSQIKSNRVTKQGVSAIPTILTTSYRYGIDSGDDELYRPLSMVLFAIEWSISPDNPHLYHFVNVLLYALMSVMLFLTLHKMTGNNYLIVSFITTLLFAAHPLHTEVVANIKSGDEILGFLFMFMAIYLALHYLKNNRLFFLLLSVLSLTLALLSKENSIVLIAILPLILFLFRATTIKKIVLLMIPYVVITAAYMVIRNQILHGINGSGNVVLMDNALAEVKGTLLQYTTAIYIVGKYIWLCILPHPLVCDYSYSHIPLTEPGNIKFIIAFLVCTSAVGFALWKLATHFKNRQEVTPITILVFGILFFFIGIFPTSNVLLMIRSTMAERFAFMPLLGYCLVLAVLISFALKKWKQWPHSYPSFTAFYKNHSQAFIIMSLLVLSYGFKTIDRNNDWKNEDTLYPIDIVKAPNNAKLHYYYANHFVSSVKEGKITGNNVNPTLDDAIAKAQRSVAILPKYYESFFVMGEAYNQKNDYANAIQYYKTAWQLGYPGSLVLNNLGNVYFKSGQPDTAIVYLKKGLAYNPNNAQTWTNLGSCYTQKQLFNDAINCYQKAVNIDPRYTEAYTNMGSAYGLMKEYTKAIEQFTKSRELDPTNATVYFYIGITYRFNGDNNNAKTFLDKACQMNPQFCNK